MNTTLAHSEYPDSPRRRLRCSSRVIAPDPQSELVFMTPFPLVTSPTIAFGVKLIAVFQVLPDGTTKDVTLVRSSGDAEWDRPAIDSMKQWRFVPLARASTH